MGLPFDTNINAVAPISEPIRYKYCVFSKTKKKTIIYITPILQISHSTIFLLLVNFFILPSKKNGTPLISSET